MAKYKKIFFQRIDFVQTNYNKSELKLKSDVIKLDSVIIESLVELVDSMYIFIIQVNNKFKL